MSTLEATQSAPPRAAGAHKAQATDRGVMRRAAVALFALLIAAQLGIVVFSLWEPAFDGQIYYDATVDAGPALWPMNVLLGGPAYAVSFVVSAIFLAVLGGGSRLAIGAAIALAVSGIVFALVITAEVLPFAWAADPAVAGETQGRALFAAFNDRLDAFIPYVAGSMAAVALATLVAVAAATRAGGLPRWVLGATVALAALSFALPLGGLAPQLASLAERALWAAIGWYGLRRLLDA